MNRRLRSTLSATVVAASVLSLGWALGEPPAPADVARHVGRDAATVLASNDATQSRGIGAYRRSPSGLAMPYFSFGRGAGTGGPR